MGGILYFKIDENTIIRIKAYDDLADYCYSKLKKGDYIAVYGRISELYEIYLEYFETL